MEQQNNSESKGDKLNRKGRELQKRIIRTYGIDMDPLYAVGDAREVGQWLLDLNRYRVETIDPDDETAQVAQDKVHTYYEAIREIKTSEKNADSEISHPEALNYLKQALLDEGIDYIKTESIADANVDKINFALGGEKSSDLGFERGFGAALVRLAASMPTIEYK